jgi:hypothetical protein
MVERVLALCTEQSEGQDAAEPLLSLLRRFPVDAARDEARMFCHDLVARPVAPAPLRLVAA